MLVIKSCEIILRWMPQNTLDGEPTLVQIMAWCLQQLAITWANVDIDLCCCYMASQGHNELTLQVPAL